MFPGKRAACKYGTHFPGYIVLEGNGKRIAYHEADDESGHKMTPSGSAKKDYEYGVKGNCGCKSDKSPYGDTPRENEWIPSQPH